MLNFAFLGKILIYWMIAGAIGSLVVWGYKERMNIKYIFTARNLFMLIGLIFVLFAVRMSYLLTVVRVIYVDSGLMYDGAGFLLTKNGDHYWSFNYFAYFAIEFVCFFGGAALASWAGKTEYFKN